MSIFTGAGVAIVTPMKANGEVNYDKLKELLDFQINNSTDAIVICGTTGESATMTEEEHIEVIRFTADYVNKRVPVIAGTGSNCTKTAIELSKEAQKAGVDGCLIVTPYYNKATQKGLIKHYTDIAKSIDLPIIMYNVPSRTGCNILPETAVKLAKEVDNIVAIKAATGNLAQESKTMMLAEGALDMYSGLDVPRRQGFVNSGRCEDFGYDSQYGILRHFNSGAQYLWYSVPSGSGTYAAGQNHHRQLLP